MEPFHPAPIFDHVVFRNAQARWSIFIPSFGYLPWSQSVPFRVHGPTPYGSWDEATGQVHHPTVFNDNNEFAVFQTFSTNNPFPPLSYPADISGFGPARP